MKIGFELEAFCLSTITKLPILVPGILPMDECGWLIEVRSEPHTDVTKAIYLLGAEQQKVERLAEKAGVSLDLNPLREIPRDLKVQAARRNGKGLIAYRNIYGYETHRNSTRFQTASLHISLTNECENHWRLPNENADRVFKYQGFIDHAKFIMGLDQAFKSEIAEAKRNPGFYERKYDGRIEYRSLPNNVNLDKVHDVLELLLPKCL